MLREAEQRLPFGSSFSTAEWLRRGVDITASARAEPCPPQVGRKRVIRGQRRGASRPVARTL